MGNHLGLLLIEGIFTWYQSQQYQACIMEGECLGVGRKRSEYWGKYCATHFAESPGDNGRCQALRVLQDPLSSSSLGDERNRGRPQASHLT